MFVNHVISENNVPHIENCHHLIDGIIERDEQSLAELYDFTLAKVYGLALKITRRHDLAEEVVEDTYMQAWQEAAKFSISRGPIMAWLMMICRSRAIDALRKLDEAETHASPEDLVNEIGNTESPLDILLLLERESDIRAAMLELNALQRQLISLAFFKGLTHEEISNQMLMPLGTIKSNIKRAQDKLKHILNMLGDQP